MEGLAGVEAVRVTSWTELNEQLFAPAWNADLGRLRSRYVYRGLADARADLRCGLMRLGGDYARLEGPILRNFMKYARREDVPGDTLWNWLALAQHHGLPTRLLDWSYSPYVALHFVTQHVGLGEEPQACTDGALWLVDRVAALECLPERLRVLLNEYTSTAFTAEMLQDVAGSLADFDALAPDEFVVFFDPPALDQRIVNQFALFSLLSHPPNHGTPWLALDRWLAARPGLARRIVIPAALKPTIRDILDEINFTERVLFPGLDGLASWLRRYYMPRA